MNINELFYLLDAAQLAGISGDYVVTYDVLLNTSIEDMFGEEYYSMSYCSSFIERGKYVTIYFGNLAELKDFDRILAEDYNLCLEALHPNWIKSNISDTYTLMFAI